MQRCITHEIGDPAVSLLSILRLSRFPARRFPRATGGTEYHSAAARTFGAWTPAVKPTHKIISSKRLMDQALETWREVHGVKYDASLSIFRLRPVLLSCIPRKESFSFVRLCLLLPLISFGTFLLLNPLCLLASVSYGRTVRRGISPPYLPNCVFKHFDNWVVKRCRLLGSFHVQCTFAE